jgi:hypothetical protein
VKLRPGPDTGNDARADAPEVTHAPILDGMGTSTRIATVAGLLFGLSGAARAQSATIFASATVLPAPSSDAPMTADARIRSVAGRTGLSVNVDLPTVREFQVALRVERVADLANGKPEVLVERRTAAPRGGRGEVEVPLSPAVLADLPEGDARARCTIYYGFDGSR